MLTAVVLLGACDEPVEISGPEPVRAQIENRGDAAVTVLFVGDTMLDDLALPFINAHGYDYPLAGLAPLVRDADVAVVNLEVAVTNERCDRQSKKYAYHMRPEGLDALRRAGYDAVVLANNHTRDCGDGGLQQILDLCEQAGLQHAGAGMNENAARRGLLFDVAGTKVGLLAYYGSGTFRSRGDQAPLNLDLIKPDVRRMRTHADVVIVHFHWGKNYKSSPTAKMQQIAREVLDAGADLIVGDGAHIMQPVGMIEGKPVIYSLGNGTFGTGNNRAEFAMMAQVVIEDKRLARIEFIPIHTQNRNPDVLFQTRLLEGREAEKVLDDLADSSRRRGAKIKIESGGPRPIGVLEL